MDTAERERSPKLWTIVACAAFDLDDFVDKLPAAAVEIGAHGMTLRIQTQAAAPLSCGADTRTALGVYSLLARHGGGELDAAGLAGAILAEIRSFTAEVVGTDAAVK